MEQKEKEAVEIVAGNLRSLAFGLDAGEMISPRDIARTLHKRADQLHGILEGDVELSDGTGGTDGTRPRQGCGGRADAAEKRVGLVGIKSNEQHILAWNYIDGLDIRVTADEARENIWQVRLESDGKLRMMASIFGGRWTACALSRGLRDAMTARRCKVRRTHANRRARKAAEAASSSAKAPACAKAAAGKSEDNKSC